MKKKVDLEKTDYVIITAEEYKALKDNEAIINRKLKNAENRYVILLWEYNKYKRDVSLAYRDVKQWVLNTNMDLANLEKLVDWNLITDVSLSNLNKIINEGI